MRGRGEGAEARSAARDAARDLAEKVRTLLHLDADATVSVSEIACGDPGCGGAETVILVMRAGRRTEAAKLLMPMTSVTEADLSMALEPLAGAPGRAD
ncbi:hypothetical protein [Aquabacter spiritensis]|nr:hypothetical protein [Aquabacter spiritensis]